MNIELTLEQQHALDSHVMGMRRVVDPRTDTAYVLVPERIERIVVTGLWWDCGDVELIRAPQTRELTPRHRIPRRIPRILSP